MKKVKKEAEFYLQKAGDAVRLYCMPARAKRWCLFVFYNEAFEIIHSLDKASIENIRTDSNKLKKDEFKKIFNKLAHKHGDYQNLIKEYLAITNFIFE